MPNKKLIILIILGIAAVISLIYGLAISAVTENTSFKRRAVRTKFISWKRSPFAIKGAAGDISQLVLNGILSSGDDMKAIINNTVVDKGSKIGDNTVVDIKKDSVILNDGTKDFELKLER